jgi:hypothetical protein
MDIYDSRDRIAMDLEDLKVGRTRTLLGFFGADSIEDVELKARDER